jgi:pimeloyl-ACP methyl ester carboxylesterase
MVRRLGGRLVVRHSYVDARPSGSPGSDVAVRLDDGRRLQVAEWGPVDGQLVLFFHGRPGSRLFCPDLAATERAGVRLISYDRAGYGRSDPNGTAPTWRTMVADAVELLDYLDTAQAAVIGWSGGGPLALACGALAGERVASVSTVCSPGRAEHGDSDDPVVLALEQAVLVDPSAARDQVRDRARAVLADRTWVTRMTERFDPHVFDAPQMRELYQSSWDEATAVSLEGYVDDWIVHTRPWDFELADVRMPVSVWYGEQDPIVTQDHAATIVDQTPHSRPFGCPECRHYVAVAHWPEILEQALASNLT